MGVTFGQIHFTSLSTSPSEKWQWYYLHLSIFLGGFKNEWNMVGINEHEYINLKNYDSSGVI